MAASRARTRCWSTTTRTRRRRASCITRLYLNDKITLSRKLTLNVGVRYDRYSSFLPEQGNPGTGPFATTNIFPYKGESNYPIYSTLVPRVSAVYDLTGEGRIALRGSYGRYVGGSSGASANPGPGADNVNPNAIITRTYSSWDGSIPYVPIAAEPDLDHGRRHQSLDRSESQRAVRRRIHRRRRLRPEPRDDAAVQLRAARSTAMATSRSTSRCRMRPTPRPRR